MNIVDIELSIMGRQYLGRLRDQTTLKQKTSIWLIVYWSACVA